MPGLHINCCCSFSSTVVLETQQTGQAFSGQIRHIPRWHLAGDERFLLSVDPVTHIADRQCSWGLSGRVSPL